MPILVDGNNLMYTLPAPQRNRSGVRHHVLELTRRERITVILVFDGPPEDPLHPTEHLGTVEIRYSGKSQADDLILSIIRKSGQARNWSVVTDDRELRRRVQQSGGKTRSCSQWSKRRKHRPKRPEISVGPRLSAREISRWEEYFNKGGEKKDGSS